MAQLLVVGISHQSAPVELRERVALDEAVWREHAPKRLGTILLSTCNRLEVYTWLNDGARTATTRRALVRSVARAAEVAPDAIEPYLVARSGTEALLHLVRVASGLDSLVVGEEQIRGQVREALRAAEATQKLPPQLRGVVQRAIESARRVRGSTQLGHAPSIAVAGVNVARRAVAGDIRGKLAVVLGAGVMARASAEALLAAGARVRVLNRTPAHAERMLAKVRQAIEIEGLDDLPRSLTEASLVVCATAAREPVVRPDVVTHATQVRSSELVLLDIALPRDVEPCVRSMAGVTLIDLDDLERLCPVDTPTRHAEEERAEALAIDEAARLADWLRFRAASPDIAELRTYAESIRTAELRRSAARLRDLTPEQLAAVEALTSGIVNKLMHGPTVALRDAARRPSRTSILRVVRPTRGRTA